MSKGRTSRFSRASGCANWSRRVPPIHTRGSSRAGVPLVLDADALNAFTGDPERLVGRDGLDVVITPHPGEMARLLNVSVEAVQHDRMRYATEFAANHRVHVVLKGHRTIVAGP